MSAVSVEKGKLQVSDGTTIVYLVHSPAKPSKNVPLVMIMGLSGSKENWFDLEKQLAQNRKVLTLDNRGIGESSLPEGPYPMERMANDAIEIANHLKWEVFDLVGVSMGGAIAQALTLNHPHRVRKLILGCTSCCLANNDSEGRTKIIPPGKKMTKEEAFAFIRSTMYINLTREFVDGNPEKIDDLVRFELSLKKPSKAIMNQIMGIGSFDATDRIKEIKQETLVLTGSGDMLVPYKFSVELNEGIKNSILRFIPKAGHM